MSHASRDEINVDARTLDRYKKTYSIPANADVTAQMVEHHWTLERSLTKMLLDSPPENRSKVWEQCYSRLYQECWWLQKLAVHEQVGPALSFDYYISLIGKPCRVYEVGSGSAKLIRFLAARGYDCVATEITAERGARDDDAQLVWHLTDGVHLDKYEKAGEYDVVLSQQVIEHIHPTDLDEHMRSALTILSPGGKYVVATPHSLFGPADLSAVFEKETPMCMHLKEYTFQDLAAAYARAGYSDIKGVYLVPGPLRRYIPFVLESAIYLHYVLLVERAIFFAQKLTKLKVPKVLLRLLLINRDVFLTARKPKAAAR